MSDDSCLSVKSGETHESSSIEQIVLPHADLQAVLEYRSRPHTGHVMEYESALITTIDEHASRLGERFIWLPSEHDNSKGKLWEESWKEICTNLAQRCGVGITPENALRTYNEIAKLCMETRDAGRMPYLKVGDTVQGSFVWAIGSIDAVREVAAYVDKTLQGLRALPEGTKGDAVLAVEGVAKLLAWFDGSIGAPSLPHSRRCHREFLLEEGGAFKDLIESSIQGVSDDHFIAFISQELAERCQLAVIPC